MTDISMADMTIRGETFKVELAGDATRPALMLSHALGVDLSMWDGQMAELAKHFRVVRYDTRGHGGSSAGAGMTSIDELGRDALAILDALKIDQVHWVGLSMGGAIGLWLLAHAPHRIAKAVVANTAPRLGSPDSWNARITSVRAQGMPGVAAATIERWFSADFAAHAQPRVTAVHRLLLNASPEGYAACCAALRDMDLRDRLDAIDRDVLVISGRDDPVVPREDIASFVRRIPAARHVVLKARHLSNVEAENAFTTAVIDFLTAPARAKAVARRTRRRATPVTSADRKAAPTPSGKKVAGRKPARPMPTKRGSASKRSNAARNPLKKATPKVGTQKKRIASPVRKPAAQRRRPAAKTVAARPAPRKTVTRKPRKARKVAPTRRATPIDAARGAIKTTAKKVKAPKTVAKSPSKIAARKLGTSKGIAKKPPAGRRKPATKRGRPTGRRTP